MSEESEIGIHTLDSSSETNELRFRHDLEMDKPGTETSLDEMSLRTLDERIRQATDPILIRVQELYALLACRTEMESVEKSEASSSRRNHESVSPSRNRYDGDICSKKRKFSCRWKIN